MKKAEGALEGISKEERDIMTRLLRMAPEQQKDAHKPDSTKGDAQRRRREKERQGSAGAHKV